VSEYLVAFGIPLVCSLSGAALAWAAFWVRYGDALRPLSRREALELYTGRKATLAELESYEEARR
jgi:hypothetical protein